MKKLLPLIPVCLLCLPCRGAPDASSLGSLVVQEGGRQKPFLVFADEATLGLTGKHHVTLDGERTRPVDFVTRLWLDPSVMLQTEMEKSLRMGKEWAQYGARNETNPT